MKDHEDQPAGAAPDETPEAIREQEDGPAADDTQELTPEAELDIADLQRKARERDEIFERLQRTTADFINYQKRMHKEREALRQFALQEFATALLPCLDGFDHAIAAGEGTCDPSLLEGVKLVEAEFLRVFANFGIERFEAKGRQFDPDRHEAIIEETTDAVPHRTVIEVTRPGYTLNGRVIRAAQVRVSRHPAAGAGPPGQ